MCGESPQGMFSTFSLLPAREQFLSGCGPHFSFALSKEKSPPQRWKRKPLRNELAPMGQLTQNEGPAATNCRESSVAFYRLRR